MLRWAKARNSKKLEWMTPSGAIAAGADDLVIGRPIAQAAAPRTAAEAIIAEIAAAVSERETKR